MWHTNTTPCKGVLHHADSFSGAAPSAKHARPSRAYQFQPGEVGLEAFGVAGDEGEGFDAGMGADEEVGQWEGFAATAMAVVEKALACQKSGFARDGPILEYLPFRL
jgi:hypothetical protein